MYHPSCLDPFPSDLADSLLDQALETIGLSNGCLANPTADEKRRIDGAVWRLVTAADIGDRPCQDVK